MRASALNPTRASVRGSDQAAAGLGLAALAIALCSGLAAASNESRVAPARAEVAERWCARGVDSRDVLRLRAALACRDWLLHLWNLGPEAMDVGYLWVLRRLEERSPEPAVEALVASWKPHFQDGRGAIVYPDAPRRWLPEDPGQGLDRFHNWVSAPSGRPASRAIEFIDAYTAIDAVGYVLTHQFLVIKWAHDGGLELPAEVRARAPGLLQRILDEHRSDPRAGDLDFERAMILLMYADLADEEARRWIARMLDSWDRLSQRWTLEGRERIHFDGRSYQLTHGPHHPTAMALGGVKTYLDRFAERAPEEARR